MKKIKSFKLFLLLILVNISFASFGQNTPDEIVSRFFIEYQKDGASKALDNLYNDNEWINRSTDAITKLKQQLGNLNEEYVGNYYGYELIVEKKLSDSFLLMSYLVKFDRQPIRFTFQFYRPNKEWRIHSFKFDGNIDDEIEESAKVYYLDLNK